MHPQPPGFSGYDTAHHILLPRMVCNPWNMKKYDCDQTKASRINNFRLIFPVRWIKLCEFSQHQSLRRVRIHYD